MTVSFSFNFSSATQELEKKAAAREDTPDAPSQSTQSSFAHTAKKPVKQGREPGQPVASAARKRKTRSKTGQMSQLRRDEEGRSVPSDARVCVLKAYQRPVISSWTTA